MVDDVDEELADDIDEELLADDVNYSDKTKKTLLFYLIQIVPAALLMSFCYCASAKDLRFVELQGSLLFISHIGARIFMEYSGLFEMEQFY